MKQSSSSIIIIADAKNSHSSSTNCLRFHRKCLKFRVGNIHSYTMKNKSHQSHYIGARTSKVSFVSKWHRRCLATVIWNISNNHFPKWLLKNFWNAAVTYINALRSNIELYASETFKRTSMKNWKPLAKRGRRWFKWITHRSCCSTRRKSKSCVHKRDCSTQIALRVPKIIAFGLLRRILSFNYRGIFVIAEPIYYYYYRPKGWMRSLLGAKRSKPSKANVNEKKGAAKLNAVPKSK